jgi:capsular polysaccharide export protein
LLRGKSVSFYSSLFYSGWGVTKDKMPKISRGKAHPSLDALVHACLIDYPRYWGPVTGTPCPLEAVQERYELGQMQAKTSRFVCLLAKLLGIFASYAHI